MTTNENENFVWIGPESAAAFSEWVTSIFASARRNPTIENGQISMIFARGVSANCSMQRDVIDWNDLLIAVKN